MPLLQGSTKRRSAQKIEKDGAIADIHGKKRTGRRATHSDTRFT
ncbi:hypothetical protein LC55x_4280 [Lysobacter capsici]|nr:hypothetical protein LC55x_4280 [Lysobacter capsici]